MRKQLTLSASAKVFLPPLSGFIEVTSTAILIRLSQLSALHFWPVYPAVKGVILGHEAYWDWYTPAAPCTHNHAPVSSTKWQKHCMAEQILQA